MAVAAGAMPLLWPALLNGYPLVFTDTGAFLAQTVRSWAGWDKPYVYGPVIALLHWHVTLWPVAIAQALGLSWLLWLAQRSWRGSAGVRSHLLVVCILGGATSAPWVATLLLPDALTPMLVIALGLLATMIDRLGAAERVALMGFATLAIASHPSHLPLAAALGLLAGLNGWRAVARCAVPLLVALAVMVAANAVLHGRAAVSPFGSVFLLARLMEDGPATRTIAMRCAAADAPRWHLCGWADRLPMDSDRFLWEPGGPVWSLLPEANGAARSVGGPIGLAPEAAAIVGETLRREPLTILGLAIVNALQQAGRYRVGDTLVPDHLASSVGVELGLGFPLAEQRRFAASLQARGLLPGAAAPWLWPHGVAMLLGAVGFAVALLSAAGAGDRRRLGLLLVVPVALIVNAGVTGALSKPHDRYQARLIWLLPLGGMAALPIVAGWRARRSRAG